MLSWHQAVQSSAPYLGDLQKGRCEGKEISYDFNPIESG
jgi:hypothetical protein